MNAINDRYHQFMARRQTRKFLACLESDALDKLLETLLRLMKFMFMVDGEFRRNIEGFEGRYSFNSGDGRIAGAAIFHNGNMKISTHPLEECNVEITFRDGAALKEFLFSRNPDVIGGILENQISYEGNLNYLGKFAFMARHLQLKYGF